METTKKGAEVLRDGSPEWRVMQLLPHDGSEVPREKVEAALGAELFKAGHGVCAKNKWIVATKTALGRAKDLGTLQKGALADLLWVQVAIGDITPEALRKVKPGRLWVNGVEVPLAP